MKFTPSCEAMKAVPSSKLGKELEAIWQEVIDYRDKELKEVGFNNRVNAIQKFFAQKTGKKFMDCVWRNTGLSIEAVFFKPHFETCFCTWMCYGKGPDISFDGTFQIEGILNGQANSLVNDFMSSSEFSVDELIKIATSYDIEKGIIKPSMRNDMKKWIRCAMGFDISLGFLSVDYLAKNSGCEYLTARELTAIMLHEIGHNLTLVEHAADMFAHISSFNALRDAFLKRATPAQAVEFAKKIGALAVSKNYNKDGNNLLTVAKQAEADLNKAGKNIDQAGEKCFIVSLIIGAFEILGTIIGTTLDVLIADPGRAFLRTAQNKKVGDVIINDRMWTWQERKADEYAFTHGYGADQVTALEKIMKFYRLLGRDEKEIQEVMRAEYGAQDLSLFTKLHLSMLGGFIFGDPGYRLYPPGSERYKEILQLTIKELKANGASAAYVSKYVADIERIIREIDGMSKSDRYLEQAMARYKAFLKLVSVRSFFDWLVHGRVDVEIVECLDDIRKLNNNLITYFGFKFDQLAKKV